MDRKFWTVGCTMGNLSVNEDEIAEMNKLFAPDGRHITTDSSYDDPAKALIDFGRRCGVIEAFTFEPLVNPDMSWLSSERIARMEPSEFVIAHRKGLDAMRGAVVWIRIRYMQL